MLTASCWVRLQDGDDVVVFAASMRPDVPAIPNCSKTTRYVTIMEPSCNKITVVRVMKRNFVFFSPRIVFMVGNFCCTRQKSSFDPSQ